MLQKKKLVWLLVMTLFTILCLEIGGRYYLSNILHKSANQKFRFNSYRIYEHVPGFKEGDGQKNWIEINSQGFRRSAEVSLLKPGNAYRIFLLGGSAAHGISSSAPYPVVHLYQDETIDSQLEKHLKIKHPGKNFEVINAAVTGYETFQHTAYILSELLNYDPDLVIFMDGVNDHFINNPLYYPHQHKEYKFWEKRLQHPSAGGLFDHFMLWVSKCSGFAKGYLSWKMQREASDLTQIQPAVIEHTSEKNLILNHRQIAQRTFLRNIEANISILKNNNIASLIALQPILVLRNERSLSHEEKKWILNDNNAKILYPFVVKQLETLCEKYSTRFIDLNPCFNKEELNDKQLFIDYCHLNALGSRVVATALFPVVDSLYMNSKK